MNKKSPKPNKIVVKVKKTCAYYIDGDCMCYLRPVSRSSTCHHWVLNAGIKAEADKKRIAELEAAIQSAITIHCEHCEEGCGVYEKTWSGCVSMSKLKAVLANKEGKQ